MQKAKDRRYAERVNLTDGKIFYRKLDGILKFPRYQGPVNLDDLSKSTISIPVVLNYARKTQIELKILVPGFPEIYLKGSVLGFEEDHNHGISKTIIQILPYGYGKTYNSFHEKKKLDRFLSQTIT